MDEESEGEKGDRIFPTRSHNFPDLPILPAISRYFLSAPLQWDKDFQIRSHCVPFLLFLVFGRAMPLRLLADTSRGAVMPPEASSTIYRTHDPIISKSEGLGKPKCHLDIQMRLPWSRTGRDRFLPGSMAEYRVQGNGRTAQAAPCIPEQHGPEVGQSGRFRGECRLSSSGCAEIPLVIFAAVAQSMQQELGLLQIRANCEISTWK